MKVTLIGHLRPIKGISPYCLHLSTELAEQVDLQFIGFKAIKPDAFYSGGSREKDVFVQKIPNTEIQNIITWYNPFSWILACLRVKGDVVHVQHWATYSSFFYCFMTPLLKLRKKKIILTIHNITPHMKNKWIVYVDKILNKMIFPFAHLFIVHNQRNKEKLIKLYHIDDKKIFIITHGVIRPETLLNIPQKKARNHLGIPIEKKALLFFGYIWDYKGLDTLLHALLLVRKQIPEILLMIAGELIMVSKEWDQYEKIIETNNLQSCIYKRIEYIPESEIELFFSAADVVVLPYREPFDTHGGVGALTLAFHKPLIVTDIGGLPEYVKDPCVISPPDHPESLAKAILGVLQNKQLYAKLVKDTKKRAQELSWKNIAHETVSVYQILLKKEEDAR